MKLKDIVELLKQAYMEEKWDSVLECINLISDLEELNTEESLTPHNLDKTDF